MTTRAKRLRESLSALGWETVDRYESRVCKCGCFTTNDEAKHCVDCGRKLPKAKISSSTLYDLERGIAYALGETKKPKGDYP